MDLHVLRYGSLTPTSDGVSMVTRLVRNTIYSKRWVVDLLLFIFLVALMVTLVEQRSTYNRVLEVGRSNNQILREVRSCTDPKGDCAVRGNKSTRDAVSTINDISIDAAYCASKQPPPARAEDVRACVVALLKDK
jgi:hypothetical protein